MNDRATDGYLQRCLDGNSGLLDVMQSIDIPPVLSAACAGRLIPRPFFVDETEIQRCAADLVDLFGLMSSLPERLFDGDTTAYCAALGIDPRRAGLMRRLTGLPEMYGRADLYHDGSSFKLLEYNVDSALGGIDRAEISRLLLQVKAFREFAEEFQLDYIHTGERIAKILRRVSQPLTGGADPVVAFVETNGGLNPYLSVYRSYQEMMRRFGLDVVLGEVSQVRSQGGRLFLQGKPIDVILRCFDIDEVLADPAGDRAVEPIFRAHEDGKVILWTKMQSGLVANKGCLALLSDPRWRHAFSSTEKDVIDRILPWTRTLVAGPTESSEGLVDLIDYCKDNREHLILKPHVGYSGDGIVAGWESTAADWKEALSSASKDGYIVQRRVIPRNEPVVNPESRRIQNWDAVWGVFITPDGYAGSQIRGIPAGEDAIINLGTSASVGVGTVFHSADV
ncbi:hypothetical protein ABR737_11535 [Streptomyces sp. Edi2]|uniref:hypothetical protein n=1 Tax=Streptomyces sp. Edi2 TaxID=3162528 RepID=UPI0033061DD4